VQRPSSAQPLPWWLALWQAGRGGRGWDGAVRAPCSAGRPPQVWCSCRPAVHWRLGQSGHGRRHTRPAGADGASARARAFSTGRAKFGRIRSSNCGSRQPGQHSWRGNPALNELEDPLVLTRCQRRRRRPPARPPGRRLRSPAGCVRFFAVSFQLVGADERRRSVQSCTVARAAHAGGEEMRDERRSGRQIAWSVPPLVAGVWLAPWRGATAGPPRGCHATSECVGL
jgi:hypothetical protein